MGTRKQYSEAFKKDAVRLMLARGPRPVADVAVGLGVSGGMLHRWHRRYAADLAQRAPEPAPADIEALRRRVRQLEQENTLLKKAAAFFAKETL